MDVGFGDEENGWWALTAWLGGAVVASLVLGFQGLPYQMPARCLIGTASWCLCEAWDRRVAQRYIDFAFGLERCENWDRIEPGDRASNY